MRVEDIMKFFNEQINVGPDASCRISFAVLHDADAEDLHVHWFLQLRKFLCKLQVNNFIRKYVPDDKPDRRGCGYGHKTLVLGRPSLTHETVHYLAHDGLTPARKLELQQAISVALAHCPLEIDEPLARRAAKRDQENFERSVYSTEWDASRMEIHNYGLDVQGILETEKIPASSFFIINSRSTKRELMSVRGREVFGITEEQWDKKKQAQIIETVFQTGRVLGHPIRRLYKICKNLDFDDSD